MVGKMKKISFLFVFLYFITLLFVVACSETGELPVAPVPEIPSITILPRKIPGLFSLRTEGRIPLLLLQQQDGLLL